ncbi:PP2C family protein-serine/threonine phosphatase [Gracilibacillus lacisalsi]|uniref:PP2C family protein-serine/threonine phosphatase n=1 Tax=Gracilibacillus lacisalsi TaxID=393087 RepID=UPI00037138F6|nr:PP2C family protein-serine/threonine phosphatase [Gracilibacillus lacisalsi]
MFRREISIEKEASNGELDRTLEREIKLARNIQMKLLNGNEPAIKNGTVSGISIPARLIGGDYYDFYLLPNGKLRIVIGDVMGKGIPAAMLMILTRGAFRSAAETTKGPADTLTAMNNAIYEDLRVLGSFVTVLCADWDPEKQELSYASAGHGLPLVVHSSQQLVDIPVAKGVMLGGLPDVVYNQNTVKIEEEDLLFFYTDGITEAQNENGDMYRTERLEKMLIENVDLDINELENVVTHSLESFTKGLPQKDDITMVIMKVNREKTEIASYNSPIL